MLLRKRMVVVHDDSSDYFDEEDEAMEEEEDENEEEEDVKEEEADLRDGVEHDDAIRQMPSILKSVDYEGC
jgi:hypothetical protein